MYEIRDSAFQLIDTVPDLVAARGPDAVGLARACKRDCIIVRVSDSVALMGFGRRPSRLLMRWRSECLPGVARAAA